MSKGEKKRDLCDLFCNVGFSCPAPEANNKRGPPPPPLISSAPLPLLFSSLDSLLPPPLLPHSGNDTDVHHLFFSRMWTVGRALDDIVATRRRYLRLESGGVGLSLELAREGSSSGLPAGKSFATSLECQSGVDVCPGDVV